MQFYFLTLALLLCQDNPAQGVDDDTEEHMVQVAVVVIAQADRIPPEFAEQAEQKLQAMSPTALPRLLRMMPELKPETQERLDICGKEIIRRAQEQSLDIPVSWLSKFAASTRQNAAARRTALRWLEQAKPGAKDAFLLEHLNDDAFRRDAIELCLLKATQPASGSPSETSHLLKKAFDESQDPDQAEKLAVALKSRGITVNPAQHLGVIDQWSCESILQSAVSVSSRATDTVASGNAIAASLKTTPANLLTQIVAKAPDGEYRIVLRSLLQSDKERNVEVIIHCNRSPRLHVNGEEIVLHQKEAGNGAEGELSEYTSTIHLLRGDNDAAFKFDDSAASNLDYDKSQVRFCVRLLDAKGKGLHEPQIISRMGRDIAIFNPRNLAD